MKKKLQDEMKNAMREKDKLRLAVIRGVLSAMQYEEMRQKKDALSDDEIMAVIRAELKKRTEALEYAEKDGRSELIEDLKREEVVLKEFLPEQMTAEELEGVVKGIKEENATAKMGDIMKVLREQYSGRYDSKMASEIVKKVLG
ncbi:MAG: GatB/YqeY domain-containing protein [Bdellovibrionota bacterium]|jgi:uncharacterized protein YqeY